MPFIRISSLRRLAGDNLVANRRLRQSHSRAAATGARWILTLVTVGAVAGGGPAARAADEAQPPAASPPAFQTEDISIGEPISLPRATPLASPAPGRPPFPSTTGPAGGLLPAAPSQLPSVIAPATAATAGQPLPTTAPTMQAANDLNPAAQAAAAGSGWLGIAVDDALVTGRLVVVEVAPGGPAARAGVRPQDMLLAINGNQLRTGDEMAAALAAIAPGQQVKMAIGRDNRVEDVVAQASARPPEALSRDWQSVPGGKAAVTDATIPAFAAAPPAVMSQAPPVSADTTIGVLPPPATVMAAPPAPRQPPATFSPASEAAEPPRISRPATAVPSTSGRTALGVRTVPVDPTVQSRFNLSEAQGAFVIGVVQDLPASRAGVPPGSVIVAINHQPVRSPQDLTLLVTRGPVGTPVPLQYVLPGGQSKQAEVVLQSLEQPLERALVGDGDSGRTSEPPALQSTPMTTRRVQPTAGSQSAEAGVIGRLEELLRRVNGRLEQMERRLERIEAGR